MRSFFVQHYGLICRLDGISDTVHHASRWQLVCAQLGARGRKKDLWEKAENVTSARMTKNENSGQNGIWLAFDHVSSHATVSLLRCSKVEYFVLGDFFTWTTICYHSSQLSSSYPISYCGKASSCAFHPLCLLFASESRLQRYDIDLRKNR